MKTKDLGSAQLGASDDVDLFGLDEFGQPAGLNPLWGAAAGTGLATLGAIGVRRFADPAGKIYGWSEGVGFAIAALASGAMIAFKGSRAAGWTGLVAAFLNSGVRQIEQMMAAPGEGTMGYLRDVVIEPTNVVQGAGRLGLVDIDRGYVINGGGTGLGQSDQMPQLVGSSLQQASDHVQLVGGPALNQFSNLWGATHFSRS